MHTSLGVLKFSRATKRETRQNLIKREKLRRFHRFSVYFFTKRYEVKTTKTAVNGIFNCFCSLVTTEVKCGCSRPTVIKWIKKLRRIEVDRQKPNKTAQLSLLIFVTRIFSLFSLKSSILSFAG